MTINKLLFVTALSFLTTSALMAKQITKEEIPGIIAQPSNYFYTGKPYDIDMSAYMFNHRNYDPAVARWSSADPSGFPDRANNFLYVAAPTHQCDPLGLQTIDGGTTPLPSIPWEYGAYIQDNTQGIYYQYRVQDQCLSWATVDHSVFGGSSGDAVTANVSFSLTNTTSWGWNVAGSFQAGVTENIKITLGGGYSQGGSTSTGITVGGSTTKAATPGVAWNYDILVSNDQIVRQVCYFQLVDGVYIPYTTGHDPSLGAWHGDTTLSTGYGKHWGVKWIGLE